LVHDGDDWQIRLVCPDRLNECATGCGVAGWKQENDQRGFIAVNAKRRVVQTELSRIDDYFSLQLIGYACRREHCFELFTGIVVSVAVNQEESITHENSFSVRGN
jgi:hypothetical protein